MKIALQIAVLIAFVYVMHWAVVDTFAGLGNCMANAC